MADGRALAHADRSGEADDAHSFTVEIGDDPAAQLRIHLRADAEPALEAGHGLVEQHAEPVDGAQAALRGGLQKRCHKRHVDEVGRDRIGARGAPVDGQLVVARPSRPRWR